MKKVNFFEKVIVSSVLAFSIITGGTIYTETENTEKTSIATVSACGHFDRTKTNYYKDPLCYYRPCASYHTSIVDALKSIGVDSSFSNRTRIAGYNGITGYCGSYNQNVLMLQRLKQGSLRNERGKTSGIVCR